MNLVEMKQSVDILYEEWDLGKTPSRSKGKVCAWIYLFEILEETEKIVIEKENGKVIGICGYAKWNSKKHIIRKKLFHILKTILILSPLVKDKKAIYKYNNDYDYTPEELVNYFDGEISILILNSDYRGKGIGKKMLSQVFEYAKNDNMKNIQILTDESCDFKFYEACGCEKVYEKLINNGEPNKCGNTSSEIGYIYEKKDSEEKIMNNVEVKKIVQADDNTLNTITEWMYNWWGKEDGYVFEEVKCFMKHSLQENRLPQTYGIFVDNKIVGMYQFAYEDLSIRPDIYPWLANVYIDEAYRNKGFCRKMMETVKENAKKNLDSNEIYLYTKHHGLYEKFGWKYVSDFDTYRKSPRIQGLYKLELN